ncbi:hypothetical protein QYF36_013114 [Acer negundo]|nr:hypothetical protein QYF36_013114 [Acer negundo]
MENLKNFFYALLLFGFSPAILVSAQDQSGFISIDCGIPSASGYNDEITGIQYISDATFVVSRMTKSIPPEFQTNSLEKQFYNVRSFLEGSVPHFDLYLGVNIRDTIKLDNTSSIFATEIIHVPPTNYIYVCLDSGWKILSMSFSIDAENPNIFRPSPAVMNTAVTPENVSESLRSKYKTAFFRIVNMKLELPMLVFEVPVSTIMFCLVKTI